MAYTGRNARCCIDLRLLPEGCYPGWDTRHVGVISLEQLKNRFCDQLQVMLVRFLDRMGSVLWIESDWVRDQATYPKSRTCINGNGNLAKDLPTRFLPFPLA